MTERAADQPTYPTVEWILNTVAEWVKKYRYAAGLRAEFDRCGPDEVADIARELGITPKELYRLALKGPEAADLLKKMLLALGVDPKTLAGRDPILMRDLQQICITCGHKKQCSHELAADTAAKNYLAFCPNAYTLETLFSAP
jgi:transcriptional regulator with XRE-family HTH domain